MVMLQQMLVLFLVMMTGFMCRKRGLLDDNANKKISGLVVNIANPALILSSGINPESRIEGVEFAKVFLLAVGMYIALMLLAVPAAKLLRAGNDENVYKVMFVFSNMGFMGFPVISATYGKEALLYASLFLIPFNVLIYTYGIQLMTKDSKAKARGIEWKNMINIGLVCGILSVLLYLSRIPIPTVLEDTIAMLSNLTAPLSMLVIGDAMAQTNVAKLFFNKRLLLFSLLKLIVLPVLGTLLLKSAGMDELLLGVCMVILATPVGSMTAMLAKQYDGDYELASGGVTLTTLLSVITLPLVSLLV